MSIQKNTSYQPLVMIIDDDATTRMQATGFLTQAGFRVAEAENGDAALNVIDEISPDVILLDVEMPGIDGFELCGILRKAPKYAVTPILMLTGLENNEAITRAYDVGATDFATKPINWSLLSHRLKYMYRGSVASEQLAREQASLAAAQRIAQLGNWEFDCLSNATQWSGQLFRIFELNQNELTPSWSLMLEHTHPDDLRHVEDWFSGIRNIKNASTIDHRIIVADGRIRSVRQQVEPELDAQGNVVRLLATVQDFTERREVENKVEQLAYYDTLTNLPNRVLFQEKLEEAMTVARQDQIGLAVLYFDLDDFKRINDTFGHAMGDKLLQEVGTRLRGLLDICSSRVGDNKDYTIARMSGDEFTLILSSMKNYSEIEDVAEKIIDVVAKPFCFGGYELFTTASIGIAIYPQDGNCAETLLKNADMAMYEAKRIGKNVFKVHNQEMDDKAKKHYAIDTQLRTALERDEFSVFYQPQLDLATGELYSAEALLRWNNDTLGMVSPVDFIPVAEDNGLIVPIGQWVLRTACLQATKWLNAGFAIPSVAVNISTLQFMHIGFPDVIRSVLQETGLPAHHLELEITESLLASDVHQAVNTLNELNEIGVKLSIDDFGTGYSSLSQLKNFPIHRLKIDQSFIKNVTESTDDAAITRAVIAMSKTMQIRVLAEGVETVEHLEFLRENGCDEIQGYFISKPMPAEQIESGMPELLGAMGELFEFNSCVELKQAG